MSVASTNYKVVKMNFILHLLFFCHPTMSTPTQDQILFFRTGGMLEESKEGIEDWTVVMGVSTQILVSSSPGLCHPICSSQLHLHHSSPGDEYFSPGKSPSEQRSSALTPAQSFSTRRLRGCPQRSSGKLCKHFWFS